MLDPTRPQSWGGLGVGPPTSGLVMAQTTFIGSGATLGETPLFQYIIPAGTLDRDGVGVRVTIVGAFVTNGDDKALHFYVNGDPGGSDTPYPLAPYHLPFWWQLSLVRIHTGEQRLFWITAQNWTQGILDASTTTHQFDEEAPIELLLTGESSPAQENNVFVNVVQVEILTGAPVSLV